MKNYIKLNRKQSLMTTIRKKSKYSSKKNAYVGYHFIVGLFLVLDYISESQRHVVFEKLVDILLKQGDIGQHSRAFQNHHL